jgi:hypothetical protein
MTPAQEERLQELEEQAVANYLDGTDFDWVDWLDTDEEKKEVIE